MPIVPTKVIGRLHKSRRRSTPLVERRSQMGFSLIEVMITIVIVSFGLLGLAGMMFSSVTAGQVSMSRSVAVNLSNEMADRIRTNWKGLQEGAYDDVEESDYAGDAACATTCVSGECEPETQAVLDICLWKKQVGRLLPGGTASIAVSEGNLSCATPSEVCSFNVTINWNENAYRAAGSGSAFEVVSSSYSVLVQP